MIVIELYHVQARGVTHVQLCPVFPADVDICE